jgi:hypothetical protein
VNTKPKDSRMPKWLPALRDPHPPYLWNIAYVLAVCLVVAVAALIGLWLAALALLNNPQLPRSRPISVRDTVGVAQLVFASVAGAGALVALVVAYRRQRISEAATTNDRNRVLNERFTAIAAQLGDASAAVRLAGVHAMAGLADDWGENRRTCVDVLCAYLRLPYAPKPGEDAPAGTQLEFRSNREVRHTVIREITRRLRNGAAVSWQGLDFVFTGVVFDGGEFRGAVFSSGTVDFRGAVFSDGIVDFQHALFNGTVWFTDAVFSGSMVDFNGAVFLDGTADFSGAVFSGGKIDFIHAVFSGSMVDFSGAVFSGGRVDFTDAAFPGQKAFVRHAVVSGGEVHYTGRLFSGGFGGRVNFSSAADWSYPPVFGWEGTAPVGVRLPPGWLPGPAVPPGAEPDPAG